MRTDLTVGGSLCCGGSTCAAVKDWLFQNTDFEGVYSYMNQENVASCATAAANGMTKIKAYENKEEKLYVYRITREEWEKSRNAQAHNRLDI